MIYKMNKDFWEEKEKKIDVLQKNIKENLHDLNNLLDEMKKVENWRIYRFYHHSFKIFYLQENTLQIVAALKKLNPHEDKELLNKWFLQIIEDGTGKKFSTDMNKRWLEETRPIVEAFYHAKYFLESIVDSGMENKTGIISERFGSILHLYNLR